VFVLLGNAVTQYRCGGWKNFTFTSHKFLLVTVTCHKDDSTINSVLGINININIGASLSGGSPSRQPLSMNLMRPPTTELLHFLFEYVT